MKNSLVMVRSPMSAALLFFLSGCDMLTPTVVTVHNTGTRRLENVQLEAGGDTVQLGAMEPAKSRTVRPKVTRDSALRIAYRQGSMSYVCDGDVYFTNNMKVKVEAEIGYGKCRVVDVTH
ncbi:hypothetical protein [Stenotrophomonas oahuensis]|uniref:Lipoprotein n=1 Tax=Stenotrophomonas oahuensis TaxID=3003271 RepID=A0ABY9YQ05_9GAMM|nr:hypothetical protein [Stenotrophomonas sp. A5586]WNH52304.1 hypothetical protein PDM29_18545 [Stenotrophomonas sp. A5586]